jgi:hypothetical protein
VRVIVLTWWDLDQEGMHGRHCWGRVGGAEGDRTPDLRAASAALSQLSYGPGKLVRVYAASLGVST